MNGKRKIRITTLVRNNENKKEKKKSKQKQTGKYKTAGHGSRSATLNIINSSIGYRSMSLPWRRQVVCTPGSTPFPPDKVLPYLRLYCIHRYTILVHSFIIFPKEFIYSPVSVSLSLWLCVNTITLKGVSTANTTSSLQPACVQSRGTPPH